MKNLKIYLCVLSMFFVLFVFGCEQPFDTTEDSNNQNESQVPESVDIWLNTRSSSDAGYFDTTWVHYDSDGYEKHEEGHIHNRTVQNTGYTETEDLILATSTEESYERRITTTMKRYSSDNEEISSSCTIYDDCTTYFRDIKSPALTKTFEYQHTRDGVKEPKTTITYSLELLEEDRFQKVYKYWKNDTPDDYTLYYVNSNNIVIRYESYIDNSLSSYSVYKQDSDFLKMINVYNLFIYNLDDELIGSAVYTLLEMTEDEISVCYSTLSNSVTFNNYFTFKKFQIPFFNE